MSAAEKRSELIYALKEVRLLAESFPRVERSLTDLIEQLENWNEVNRHGRQHGIRNGIHRRFQGPRRGTVSEQGGQRNRSEVN